MNPVLRYEVKRAARGYGALTAKLMMLSAATIANPTDPLRSRVDVADSAS
jgi:hypothetical protein